MLLKKCTFGVDNYNLPIVDPPTVMDDLVRGMFCVQRSCLHPRQVQVALYDDRPEIISSGALTTEMTIEKMKRGVSIPRNKAIAEAFNYMGVIDKWGSGVPRLFEDAAAYGLPASEMEDLEGEFVILFPRRLESLTDQTDQKADQTPKPTNKRKISC